MLVDAKLVRPGLLVQPNTALAITVTKAPSPREPVIFARPLIPEVLLFRADVTAKLWLTHHFWIEEFMPPLVRQA